MHRHPLITLGRTLWSNLSTHKASTVAGLVTAGLSAGAYAVSWLSDPEVQRLAYEIGGYEPEFLTALANSVNTGVTAVGFLAGLIMAGGRFTADKTPAAVVMVASLMLVGCGVRTYTHLNAQAQAAVATLEDYSVNHPDIEVRAIARNVLPLARLAEDWVEAKLRAAIEEIEDRPVGLADPSPKAD